MNVLIKTPFGNTFSVTYPPHWTEADLPFLVYEALRARSVVVPFHHIRLLPAEEGEQEGEGEARKVFHLLIEDPNIQVRIYYHDTAVVVEKENEHDQEHEDEDDWERQHLQERQEMEVYLLRVLSHENIIFEHYFYTPVAYVGTVDQPRKRYSNIYYHEDSVEVIYNPSFEARMQSGESFREVELRSGAIARHLPSAFSLFYPLPSFQDILFNEIDRAWMEHVRKTGEPNLYPIQCLHSQPI